MLDDVAVVFVVFPVVLVAFGVVFVVVVVVLVVVVAVVAVVDDDVRRVVVDFVVRMVFIGVVISHGCAQFVCKHTSRKVLFQISFIFKTIVWRYIYIYILIVLH